MNKKFNTQFATQKLRQETSATNFGGATFTPGTGEQMATNKAFKKKEKKEVKDVEPKLAAGKAKIYMKDKWGWKDAPSVPNRPSKGGFIYKQLFEELSEFVKENEQIEELFNIYPESEDQISDPNIKAIYKLLKTVNPNIEKPISLDKSKPKVIKIARDFEKDKKALAALTKLTGKDFEEFADLLKTKRGKERYTLKVGEKPVWNGITILFGSGAKNLPKGSKPYDTAASWRDTRKLALRVGLLREDLNKNVDEVFSKADYEKAKLVLSKLKDTNSKLYNAIIALASDVYPHDLDQELGADIQAAGLNENYSKFKTETKTRNKPDQFHQAVRAVKKKVQEINRLFEYVSRLKEELSEGQDGLKYKMHTEKALAKIKDMVNELNKNIKKFK